MTKVSDVAARRAVKKPAGLADQEIHHLEAVLSSAGLEYALTAVRGLDGAYWSSRLGALAMHYDLLPSQNRRIGALLRTLNSLDRTIDGLALDQQNAPSRLAA